MRLAAVILCFSGLVTAQTELRVPLDYPTIQQAVDAAVAGDVVVIAPGVYSESIDVTQSIELRSECGPETTHIVPSQFAPFSVRLNTSGQYPGPILSGLTIRDGLIGYPGVAVWGPAAIKRCVVRGHDATGVFVFALWGDVEIDGCAIIANTGANGTDVSSLTSCGGDPSGRAGGVDARIGGFVLSVRNTVIAGNTGGHAGTVSFPCQNLDGDGGVGGLAIAVQATFENCTIVGNSGGGTFLGFVGPGGIEQHETVAGPILINTIVQGNSIPEVGGSLHISAFSSVTADHSNVAGYTGPGTGNIDTDPHLADPVNGDYGLSASSPCIDAGDSTVANLSPEDVAGSPRIVGADVDMGAYEFVPPLAGTGEGLELRTMIDGSGADLHRKYAPGGSDLVATVEDDLGTLSGAVPVLLGQVFGNGSPPIGIPSFPLHLDLAGLAVFHDGNATPGLLVGALPVSFGPVAMPPGLAGLTLRLQAFGLSPAAANSIYAATHARDLVFQ